MNNMPIKSEVIYLGEEKIPVIVLDDFVADPQALVDFACDDQPFVSNANDYYPGSRKTLPDDYGQQVCRRYLPLLKSTYDLPENAQVKPLLCALSLTTTPVSQLRPIQMLPHFDTPAPNQLAVVHYLFGQELFGEELSGPEQGGTSFYRHRQTGYETITPARLAEYRGQLKQQAMQAQLHKNPAYIDGDTELFERLHCFAAKFNRALIYPSNALHSGDIKPAAGLSDDPRQGRLTANSFVVVG